MSKTPPRLDSQNFKHPKISPDDYSLLLNQRELSPWLKANSKNSETYDEFEKKLKIAFEKQTQRQQAQRRQKAFNEKMNSAFGKNKRRRRSRKNRSRKNKRRRRSN